METENKYEKFNEDYKDLSDFFAGERKIKSMDERYTPRLEGHSKDDGAYHRYKNFGILYNALSRTRQGLKGAILRKPVDIQFPEANKAVLDRVMRNGASFLDLTRMVCDAVLGFGRYGVLVDLDANETPYVSTYPALSIKKWPEVIGEGIQQEIELSEYVEIPDPEDEEKTKTVEQRRKLEIDETLKYKVSVYQKVDRSSDRWELIPSTPENPNPRWPKYKGRSLDRIPFTFFGSSNNTPEPSRPPLLDLLCILKGHWKVTVSYQYGLAFAGLPTPCFAGFNFKDGQEIALGPGAAHWTPESSANSWFLMTEGRGLTEMEKGLDRLEKQMAVVGARLLEEQRPGIEAAETVRLRSSGDSASLADIAGNVETGLTKVLQDIGFWVGISENNVSVGVNKDFVSAQLSAQDITALLAAVQAGEISSDTFIYNLQQGEILQTGKTVEEEKELIEEEMIKKAKQSVEGAGGFEE